jgi:ribosomal protein S18 acetylase RimI-like enzyme
MSQYEIRSLQPNDLRQMHRSFLEAFSGYPVPMQLSYSLFEKRILGKLNIRFDLSFGVFSGQKLVGFIFHSLNNYKGVATIYNGGTGVIPGHRGHRLTRQLYRAFQEKALLQAKRCLLEVITVNQVAIKVYEEIGFRKVGFYNCYKLNRPLIPVELNQKEFRISGGSFSRKDLYRKLDSLETSFSDTFDQLVYNIASETFVECVCNDKVVGYIVFQAESGRITRIAVDTGFRRRHIGSRLLYEAYVQSGRKNLTAINIPETAREIAGFLLNAGFENQVDQWEMELTL